MHRVESKQFHIRKAAAARALIAGSVLIAVFLFFLFYERGGLTYSYFNTSSPLFGYIVGLLFTVVQMCFLVFIILLLRNRIIDFFGTSPFIELSAEHLKIRRLLRRSEIKWDDVASAEFTPYQNGRGIFSREIELLILKYTTADSPDDCKSLRVSISSLTINPEEFKRIFTQFWDQANIGKTSEFTEPDSSRLS